MPPPSPDSMQNLGHQVVFPCVFSQRFFPIFCRDGFPVFICFPDSGFFHNHYPWKKHMETTGNIVTLWLFNIAMENGPFIDDFPIKTSIDGGFSMAMLNNQMVFFHQDSGPRPGFGWSTTARHGLCSATSRASLCCAAAPGTWICRKPLRCGDLLGGCQVVLVYTSMKQSMLDEWIGKLMNSVINMRIRNEKITYELGCTSKYKTLGAATGGTSEVTQLYRPLR